MKVYVLYNEEIGYIDDCPTFANEEQAELAAGNKCRFHSVRVKDLADLKPCHPAKKYSKCEGCPRFAGVRE